MPFSKQTIEPAGFKFGVNSPAIEAHVAELIALYRSGRLVIQAAMLTTENTVDDWELETLTIKYGKGRLDGEESGDTTSTIDQEKA